MPTKTGIEVGDRVKLLKDPDLKYGVSASNPAIGSKWECAGTVIRIVPDAAGTFVVEWDNKALNYYSIVDLVLVDLVIEGNGECGTCLSIW